MSEEPSTIEDLIKIKEKIHNLRMPTYYVIPSVETNDSLSEKQQLKLIWDKILLYSPEKFRQFITSPDQLKSAIHEFSDYAEQIREKFSESFFSNDDFLNSIINTSEDLISFKELLPKKSEILLKKFLSMSPEKFCKIVTSISALYNIINCFSKTAIEINNAVSIKNKFSNLFFDDNNEKYFFHIINKVEDIIEIKKLFPENKKLLLKKFLSPQKIFLSADLPQEQEKFFNVITSLSELQNLMNNFDDSYSDIEIKFCDKILFDNDDKYFCKIINTLNDLREFKKMFPQKEHLLLEKLLLTPEKFCNIIRNLSELSEAINIFDKSYTNKIKTKFCELFFSDNNFFNEIINNTSEFLINFEKILPEKVEFFLEQILSDPLKFSKINKIIHFQLQNFLKNYSSNKSENIVFILINKIEDLINKNDLNILNSMKNLLDIYKNKDLQLFITYLDNYLKFIKNENESEYMYNNILFLRNYLTELKAPAPIVQDIILNNDQPFSIDFQIVKNSGAIDILFFHEKKNIENNKIILVRDEFTKNWHILARDSKEKLICRPIEQNSLLLSFLKKEENDIVSMRIKNESPDFGNSIKIFFGFFDLKKWKYNLDETALKKAKEYLEIIDKKELPYYQSHTITNNYSSFKN